jgi:hypothetical protein
MPDAPRSVSPSPASPRRRAAALALAVAVGIAVAWLMFAALVQPSNARDWSPDQARLATADFDGDALTVHNVRNARYRSTTDYDVHWETRRYRLDELESAWFVVEPFSDWRGPAHTFLSFGFRDGRYLAVSAEVRKERGESYSPLKGLFRQYELMLVVGDERDLIGLRALHRRDEVFLYRLKATPAESRALLAGLLRQANAFNATPVFYNTVSANCTSTIVDAVESLRPGTVPMSWRTLLPGYSDDLAFDLGLLDTTLPRETYRDAHRVNARAERAAGALDFSAGIRTPSD